VAELVKALKLFTRVPLAHTDDISDDAVVFEYDGGSIKLGHLRDVHDALTSFREAQAGGGV